MDAGERQAGDLHLAHHQKIVEGIILILKMIQATIRIRARMVGIHRHEDDLGTDFLNQVDLELPPIDIEVINLLNIK